MRFNAPLPFIDLLKGAFMMRIGGARGEVKIDETLVNVRLRQIRPPEADFQPKA